MTPEHITFAQALDEYISSKDNLLSPATIRGYRTMQRNCFNEIKDIFITDINEKQVQKWINAIANDYSAKSIKNQVGLMTVVLAQNGIKLNMKVVTMKRRIKTDYNIPTEQDIQRIAAAVKHTPIEIPVIIAITLGLRQSEIAGLKWENYDGKYIVINSAVVPNEHNQLVEKSEMKSYESTRVLAVPDYLKEILDNAYRVSDRISPRHPGVVLRKFHRICEENGIPRFTMHSLRHANASAMLKLNIPDKYAMERMGHSTPNMLKQVYQHIYREEQIKVAEKMNDYYNELLNK